MTPAEKEKFSGLCTAEGVSLGDVPCSGKTISVKTIAETLLNAFDEDVIEPIARKNFDIPETVEIPPEKIDTVCEQLATSAAAPFNNPKIRKFLEDTRKSHYQIIDNVNMDEVTFSGWDSNHTENAKEAIETFARFIEENKNTLDALQIIYNQSYKNRPLTLKMVEELYDILQKPPYALSAEKLWMAYSIRQPDKVRDKSVVNKLADIVSLIRFQLGQTSELRLFSDAVNLRFRDWIMAKNAGHGQFTEEQTEWLRMIRDHIATSMSITPDDLGYTPFDAKGGLGRFHLLFGNEYENILNEMNFELLKAA
jgi:type I restriction enzyme R subunit